MDLYILAKLVLPIMKRLLLFTLLSCTTIVSYAQKHTHTPDLVVLLGGAVYFNEGSSVIKMAENLQASFPNDSIQYIPAHFFIGGHTKRKTLCYIKEFKAKHPEGRLILYGYSIGADYLLKLQRRLAKSDIPVDLFVTVDAVGRRARNIKPIVKQQLNLYQETSKKEFWGYGFNAWMHGRPNTASESTLLINVNIEPLDLDQFVPKKYEVVAHKNLKNITEEFVLWYVKDFMNNGVKHQGNKDWLQLVIDAYNGKL